MRKQDGWFDDRCEFKCLSALEILNYGKEKKRQLSYQVLYKKLKMSGSYPAQILKENVVRWIKTHPLDVKDTAPPKVLNDASRIPKRQKQW